ncbi:GtrA family protein [uncultured Massilia sp.]|uniref:GtrA family protein n=1 Tax=uncultured Massilia sp. TaxID=169973 RepID=UPI0025DE474F|nr:GtrA family protein [uncultured Massilia sp.]
MVRSYSPSTSRFVGTQFAKFAAVGGLGTGLHYLVLVVLVTLLHVAPGRAAFAGAAAGACLVYLLNRRYTFASDADHRRTLPRFVALAVAGALLNGLLVGLLSGAGLHFLLAQVVATAVVLVINFIVSKTWIFR